MKNVLFFLLLLSTCFAQAQRQSDAAIDRQMQAVTAPTPDSLGRFIKATYATGAERVRAAYAWIVNHIAYNTAIYKPRTAPRRFSPDPLDTAAVWPSGDEMTARKVMRTGVAVCDGYAKLFRTLCDYAGVEAEIILGFARGAGSPKFKTNHSWNAVRLDSAWYLLDVTWASGYLTGSDDFVRLQNDYWYLTPPAEFLQDHHPEQLRWTLLSSPPTLPEFRRSPFRAKNFSKYNVERTWPEGGVVEAIIGDTIEFRLHLKNAVAAKGTGNDPFVSTADWLQSPASVFLSPDAEQENDVVYRYIVAENTTWIHLLFNSDVVLRYQLRTKPRKLETLVLK